MGVLPTCPNCDGPILVGPQLFCSEQCQQTAGLIRWWRNIRANGKIDDIDIQDTLHMRLVKTVKGGYPRKERHLDPVQRYQIFERDQGLCVKCKQPGKEIDHINGSSPDPSNLQLLCRTCHEDKTYRDLAKLETDEEIAIAKAIEQRALAEHPVRLCDDAYMWDKVWRSRMAAIRKFFKGEGWSE